jgi:protein LTV1
LRIADLEDELDIESVRQNEGEAANYGIYYDDTGYDYMQHLREMGSDPGESHSVDSAPVMMRAKGKGKGKSKMMKLEDALREASLDEDETHSGSGFGSIVDDGLSSLSSTNRPRTYQDMQDVPDEIAGFQPDMDPRLREVLEALEDDAYVDEKAEEDVFGALTRDGQEAELDLDEFEAMQDGQDDGWESDATEKAAGQQLNSEIPAAALQSAPADSTDMSSMEAEAASAEDGDWLRNFAKFKREDAKRNQTTARDRPTAAPSDVQAPPSTLYTLGGTPLRQKRRKGALTNPSAYSMTSSSLARTEGQRLLDDRFEKMEATYALDEAGEFNEDEDGGMSLASGVSKQSKMSAVSLRGFADGPVRNDLDGMMDGFLDGWDKGHPGATKRKGAKGKRGKNGNELVGMRMLDEVREGLGPARLRAQKA